jgi:hypothetical protein
MTVDQSGPADSYGERSLKRAWNFSEISRQQTWGSLQFRLWVIDGLVIGGQRQPLSVVSPIASLAVQCSECSDVPLATLRAWFAMTDEVAS